MPEWLTLAFWASVFVIVVPYWYASLAGCLTERAGVVDLAIEGKLLWGAFAAAVVAHASDSLWLGLGCAALTGAAVGGVQALLADRLRANHVVIGVGLNLLALAGTRLGLQLLYGQSANSPACPTVGDRLVNNPLFWGALLAVFFIPLWLQHSVGGTLLRAAGDQPQLLQAAGTSIHRVRQRVLLQAGALAGLGGAQLSFGVGSFIADITSGRGYLALAAIILAGWRPGRAALLVFFIATVEATNFAMQVRGSTIPRELVPVLPHLVTLLIVAMWGGGRRPPRALGEA